MGLLEDIVNGLKGFFDAYVVAPVRGFFDRIWSGIEWLKSTVPAKLEQVWSKVISVANEVAAFIAPKFDWLNAQFWQRIQQVQSFVQTNIVPAVQQIWPRIQQGFQAVENFRQQIIQKVFSLPVEIYNRIHPYIAPIENWVKSFLPQVHQAVNTQILPRLQQLNTTVPLLQGNIPVLTFQMLMPKMNEFGLDLKKKLDDMLSPFADLLNFFKKMDASGIMENIKSQAQQMLSQFTSLAASITFSRSLVSPEDAVLKEKDFMPKTLAMWYAKEVIATVIEGMTAGQVDINLKDLFDSPDTRVIVDTYMSVQKMKIEMAFLKPLEYFYNRYYTPEIPPVQDLITMVVREAFVPERVTPAPKLFADYMALKGFAKEWADRYWSAHWVLIPLERATEMYWRGIMTEDFYKKYLVLHDYRPDEIDYIMKWVWRPPNRIEARMMYDLGVLDDKDLDYIAKASGIEERFREGWKQMIRGFRVRPLLTRIETIATDAYENGYIGTSEYQKLLKEAGFSDVVIDWVLKVGQLERRFTLMKMSVDTIVLKFRKGVIDKNTAMQQLTSLGLDTDTALHHLNKAEVQAMRASDKAKEKAPKLTAAQLISAWKKGVLETEDVVDALLAKGYTEQEARILIETELAKAAAA
jgi:hypothetical protein